MFLSLRELSEGAAPLALVRVRRRHDVLLQVLLRVHDWVDEALQRLHEHRVLLRLHRLVAAHHIRVRHELLQFFVLLASAIRQPEHAV